VSTCMQPAHLRPIADLGGQLWNQRQSEAITDLGGQLWDRPRTCDGGPILRLGREHVHERRDVVLHPRAGRGDGRGRWRRTERWRRGEHLHASRFVGLLLLPPSEGGVFLGRAEQHGYELLGHLRLHFLAAHHELCECSRRLLDGAVHAGIKEGNERSHAARACDEGAVGWQGCEGMQRARGALLDGGLLEESLLPRCWRSLVHRAG